MAKKRKQRKIDREQLKGWWTETEKPETPLYKIPKTEIPKSPQKVMIEPVDNPFVFVLFDPVLGLVPMTRPTLNRYLDRLSYVTQYDSVFEEETGQPLPRPPGALATTRGMVAR